MNDSFDITDRVVGMNIITDNGKVKNEIGLVAKKLTLTFLFF